MSRHLGLIIGVNQYQDSTFRPLRFAENDARALAQWLVNTKGGKWSPPDVQLVQGQHATKELIESLVSQICIHKADPGDVVLLYFAGHAFLDEKTGESFVALSNSFYRNPATCISLLSLTQNILARSRAGHILCVMDCFQTGQIWDKLRTSPFDSKPLLNTTMLNTLQQHPNRLFLGSCRGNAATPERGEKSLGPLIHNMILGLCGPAVESATGNVTLPKLHAYLFKSLDEQHKPQLFGQQQSSLVLVGDLPSITRPISGTSPDLQAARNANQHTTAAPHSSGMFKQPGLGTQTTAEQHNQSSPYATMAPPDPKGSPESSTSGHRMSSATQQGQQMLEQAQQLFQAQSYGEAFNLVEQILKLTPQDPSALTLKGQLLGTAGRYQEALTVIDQLVQADPNNAIGWSMRAVAMGNMGQYQPAFTAIERSLELDAKNPESYAIKNNIMASMAHIQSQHETNPHSKFTAKADDKGETQSFTGDVKIHALGLILGVVGAAILIVAHGILAYIGLLFLSAGLAINCVIAARGAFRNGISRVGLAFLLSLVIGGLLGALYVVGHNSIFSQLNTHPSLLLPLLFILGWLAGEAALPLFVSICGFISSLVTQRHAK